MLIVRGILVMIGGFAFVFLPGAVISVLTLRDPRHEPSLLLWGMGILIATLFPALFLVNLVRLIILGNQTPEQEWIYLSALLGSIVLALFLEGGKYLFLRWRNIPEAKLLNSGMMIGLGIGVLTNVFHGLALIGAGMRLLFGDTSTPDLAATASQPWLTLIASLVALNVYRLALVAVSAALGVLVARALIQRRLIWLWAAVGISSLTAWLYTVIGLALGADTLVGSLVAVVVEGLLAFAALRWLMSQLPNEPQSSDSGGSAKKHKRAAAQTS